MSTSATAPQTGASAPPPDARATAGAPPSATARRALDVLARYAVVIVLVVLLIVATLVNDGFWTGNNLRNVLTQNAPIALIAFGMTFVIIGGAFDLSVGAIFAAGAVFYSMLAKDWTLPYAATFTIGIGVLAGLINGLVVTKMRVNAFIGTIGTGAAFGGIVSMAANSSPVQVEVPHFEALGLGRVAGIPWPVAIAVAVFALLAFALSRTVFGRQTFASGGNPEAARLSGISVDRVQIATFVLVAVLSVVGGMITASQLSVGQPTLGANTALDAFAIVVIGGTSVYGGQGALWRTATGVLVLAVLTNIFNSLAWDSTRQAVAKGVVLVLAVALDAARRRRR